MDTTTHITMGIGLAGLAFLDPVISSHPDLTTAVLLCTVLGSNAPDFDIILKSKGNEAYVKQHRGLSHSVPAVAVWSLLIAIIVTLLFGQSYFFTFLGWTFVSVVIHVLFDLCNIYGTQAFRPFTTKWIALHLLPIVDPVIIVLHVLGFIMWANGFHPGYTFLIVYLLMTTYIGGRIYIYKGIVRKLKQTNKNNEIFTLLPSLRLNSWGIIAHRQDQYRLGKYENGKITWSKVLRKTSDHNVIIRASKKSHFIRYIINNSKFLHAKIFKKVDGYEVHWFDLRYQSRIDEPFIAIIYLDKKLNLVKSNVKHGLIPSPEKM